MNESEIVWINMIIFINTDIGLCTYFKWIWNCIHIFFNKSFHQSIRNDIERNIIIHYFLIPFTLFLEFVAYIIASAWYGVRLFSTIYLLTPSLLLLSRTLALSIVWIGVKRILLFREVKETRNEVFSFL